MAERVIEYRVDEAPVPSAWKAWCAASLGPALHFPHDLATTLRDLMSPWGMASEQPDFRVGARAE